jgi:hypothetical protein
MVVAASPVVLILILILILIRAADSPSTRSGSGFGFGFGSAVLTSSVDNRLGGRHIVLYEIFLSFVFCLLWFVFLIPSPLFDIHVSHEVSAAAHAPQSQRVHHLGLCRALAIGLCQVNHVGSIESLCLL